MTPESKVRASWCGDVGSCGTQDVTVAIGLPMREAALMDVLGVFQSGNLSAAVTMRQES